ncbi:MAG TPA: ComEA family DNA-binding protein [Thermopolyspora sp.]|jgi:DNA uptake protein and related DNA-binding proteins
MRRTAQPTTGESRLHVLASPETVIEKVRAAAQAPHFDLGRPRLRILLFIGALAALAAAIFALRSRPVAEPLPPPVPVGAQAVRAAAFPTVFPASPAPSAGVTVQVTGKVREPGVLTLPAGSRVVDAIKAAGGVRAGAKTGLLNLARRLVDGEQIIVDGRKGAAPPIAPGPPGASAVLDLNAATAEQLDQGLPGVGEVLARRIIDYRDTHGGFRSVTQLRDVSGIGERTYAEIRDKVRA